MRKTLLMLVVMGLAVMALPGCGGTGDKDGKTSARSAPPARDPHEAILEDMIATMTEMVDVLETVQDPASAEAAAPKLEALVTELNAIEARMEAIGDPDPAKEDALMAVYEEPMQDVFDGFMEQMMRLQMEPELFEPLAEVFMQMN